MQCFYILSLSSSLLHQPSHDSQVMRTRVKGSVRGPNEWKGPRANNIRLIYWRDASYSLSVSLINIFGFYLSFLGTGHVGPWQMSLIGGWCKNSWILSACVPHGYLVHRKYSKPHISREYLVSVSPFLPFYLYLLYIRSSHFVYIWHVSQVTT